MKVNSSSNICKLGRGGIPVQTVYRYMISFIVSYIHIFLILNILLVVLFLSLYKPRSFVSFSLFAIVLCYFTYLYFIFLFLSHRFVPFSGCLVSLHNCAASVFILHLFVVFFSLRVGFVSVTFCRWGLRGPLSPGLLCLQSQFSNPPMGDRDRNNRQTKRRKDCQRKQIQPIYRNWKGGNKKQECGKWWIGPMLLPRRLMGWQSSHHCIAWSAWATLWVCEKIKMRGCA